MAERPNVVLLVFDTLRADFPACFPGDPQPETPNIDRLAGQGVRFDNAFSVAPGTPHSHGALFSGQYPSETGIVGPGNKVPTDIPLIASWLGDAGYETFGICGPAKIAATHGFDRGFDEYFESFHEHVEPDFTTAYLKQVLNDSLVLEDALRTLRTGLDSITSLKFDVLERELGSMDEPFFAFANLLTCHATYNPPRPYKENATPELSRPRVYALELLLEKLAQQPETFDHSEVRYDRLRRASRGQAHEFHGDPNWLNESELTVLEKWYEASLEYLDYRLGEFLTALRSMDVRDDTVFVITSDHGEHFGEHDLLYHGYFLTDEVLHVPLIISGPNVPENAVRTDLVSLVDVFDTICDVCRLDPPEATSGESVFSDGSRDAVFAEYGIKDISQEPTDQHISGEKRRRFGLGRKCIRTPDHRFVLASDGSTECYHLPEQEAVAPSGEAPDGLHTRLTTTLTDEFRPIAYGERTSPEVVENLKSLGYLQ
jgi:arylsulfatase A-like enzyme